MPARDDDRLLRQFCWARLGLACILLALFPLLPRGIVLATDPRALATALLGIVVSAVTLLLLPSLGEPRRLSWLICLLDVVLVTGVVAVTGGATSIFTFLYVLSVIAACVLLSRVGGLVMAGAASLLYTGLVLGRSILPLSALVEAHEETTALDVVAMFLNAGTFLVVAVVAGGLAERFQVARRELESQRKDLLDLRAFKDLIFQSVGAGLIAVDGEGRITAFNRAAETISGCAAGRALGQPWATVFGPSVPLEAVTHALTRDPAGSVHREATIRRLDGATVPVRVTFSALRAADDTPLGLIGVCEDLSTLRALEARMRQADRLATLGRMAANIAHEIRNPLASLTGAIEGLAGNLAEAESRERLVRIVVKESDRLNQIIRDFLEYARPAPLTLHPSNVAEILDEVLFLLEHRARPGTLKIVREFSPSIVATVDPQQFRQAVWNLCLNALEAMPGGGELRVWAALERGRLRLRVSDTGEGITAGDLAHIFEPFYSTKAGGSGLGLALVHRIVQDHGGEIDVHSGPAAGATFTLTVPALHG